MDKREKTLREELGSLSEKMKGILSKADKEERELTEEEQDKFDGLNEKADKKRQAIDNHVKSKALEAEMNAGAKEIADETSVKVGKSEKETEGARAQNTLKLLKGVAFGKGRQIEQAVEELARGGHYGDDAAKAEQRAAGDYYSTGVDADGGYLLPVVVSDEIEELAKQYGAARQLADIFPHIVGTIKVPSASGDMKASAVSEGGAISSNMRNFEAIELNPQKWASIVPWTYEIGLEASAKILSDINRSVARGFANAEDDAMLNGDGTATYNSITGVINNTDAGATTLAAGNEAFQDITPDNLVLARNDIDEGARGAGAYVFHPDMEAIFLTKQDGQGAYIFDYRTEGNVSMLKGRPVVYTAALPGLVSSAEDTAFGAYGNFEFWKFALGQGLTTEQLSEATIKDADTGADFNLATQDAKALKFRELFDMGTNFGEAFTVFTTALTPT